MEERLEPAKVLEEILPRVEIDCVVPLCCRRVSGQTLSGLFRFFLSFLLLVNLVPSKPPQVLISLQCSRGGVLVLWGTFS